MNVCCETPVTAETEFVHGQLVKLSEDYMSIVVPVYMDPKMPELDPDVIMIGTSIRFLMMVHKNDVISIVNESD
jgi:hypothetical protein